MSILARRHVTQNSGGVAVLIVDINTQSAARFHDLSSINLNGGIRSVETMQVNLSSKWIYEENL